VLPGSLTGSVADIEKKQGFGGAAAPGQAITQYEKMRLRQQAGAYLPDRQNLTGADIRQCIFLKADANAPGSCAQGRKAIEQPGRSQKRIDRAGALDYRVYR